MHIRKATLLFLSLLYTNLALCDVGPIKEEKVSIKLHGALPLELFTRKTVSDESLLSNSVRNAFDGSASKFWIFRFSEEEQNAHDVDPKNASLLIMFPQPVHVKMLKVINGCPKPSSGRKNYDVAKKMYVERLYMRKPTYPFGAIYSLRADLEPQIFDLQKKSSWQDVFKAIGVLIHVFETYSRVKISEVCISEIDLEYSNQSTYKPSLPWQELSALIRFKARYDKSGKWEAKEIFSSRDRLLDFLYYVANNNVEAKKLFDSYSPKGASDSESMDFVFRPAVEEALSKRH